MKAFLFVFDPSRDDRGDIIRALDGMPDIENWNAFFGNTMVLASRKDSRSLSGVIRKALPGLRFILTEVDPERKGGWLPRSLWGFLNDPQPAGSQPADA